MDHRTQQMQKVKNATLVQYNIIQYNTIQDNTIQHNTTQDDGCRHSVTILHLTFFNFIHAHKYSTNNLNSE